MCYNVLIIGGFMKKCKYCGRYMRNKVDACYSCGSNEFDNNEKDNIIIINAPKEGFNVPTLYEENEIKKYNRLKKYGLYTLPFYFLIIFIYWFPLLSIIYFYIFIQLIFVTIFLIAFGSHGINHYKNEIKRLNNLKNNGVLVKNLSYKVIPQENNYYKYSVSFQMDKNTKSKKIMSNKKFATELFYNDELIDVLVNPSNHDDYYIGFDIY